MYRDSAEVAQFALQLLMYKNNPSSVLGMGGKEEIKNTDCKSLKRSKRIIMDPFFWECISVGPALIKQ